MASRCRSISRPALTIFKSGITKQCTSKTASSPSLIPLSSPSISRSFSRRGCLQSFLPLHTAVASARLNSCLGIDTKGSRSLSQGIVSSANPGV